MTDPLLERALQRLPDDAHPIDRLSWRAYLSEAIAPALAELGPPVPAPHPIAQGWMRTFGHLFWAPAAWRAWLHDEEARELLHDRLATAYPAWLISRALDAFGRDDTQYFGYLLADDLVRALWDWAPLQSKQGDTDVVALVLILHVLRHSREPGTVVEALASIRRTRLWGMTMAGAPRTPEAA